MQHHALVTATAQGNNIGADGAQALRPALEKLRKLEALYLERTCGDVHRRSAQGEQCARVGGGAGQRSGQAVVVACDDFFTCEV